MLKILSSQQIREADSFTISNEPIDSIDLMERAASRCFEWLCSKYNLKKTFLVCCGKGNNGGDGLAIARLLIQKGYTVNVILFAPPNELSEDCKINFDRLQKLCPANISLFSALAELPLLKTDVIVIDALFGSGLNRALEKPFIEIVDWINSCAVTVVSIDIPSGLLTDQNQHYEKNAIIKADFTLSFQSPKLSFLLPLSGCFVGELDLLSIGLNESFIASIESPYFFTEKSDIQKLLHKRPLFSHKGNYGHALIVAGSPAKMGAAILCTHACLRSGTGLVSALVPSSERAMLQSTLPEAMLLLNENGIDSKTDLSNYTAIGIGPGLGTSKENAQSIKLLIQNYTAPLVFDADAINLLSENKTWLGFLKAETVFTPHLKEFERLTGKAENDFHRLQMAKNFSTKFNTYLILKGKYTCVVCPDGKFYFNSTGNPGMAKGGSGDVLTGIITSLLAQGYRAKEACLIGVYIHGLAGDSAAQKFSETALLAGDIITCLPDAFKQFSWENTK